MATKEQIAEWKKTHGEVYEITVINEDQNGEEIVKGGKKEYKSYHKKIGKRTIQLAMHKSNGLQDPIKFGESIVISSFLDGDIEVKTIDEFVNVAAEKLQEFVKQAEGRIKKL